MKSCLLAGEAALSPQPLSMLITETMRERMRGLLGRAPLRSGQAMMLCGCNMVHTFGMAYPIDVVFVDEDGVIRKVCPAVPRRRMRACLRATCVLELPAGEAARRGWAVGMALPFLRRPSP